MLEVSALRKTKINLADYNSRQDIENRTVISDFSPFDLSLVEEILFSPLKISLKKLARNLGVEDAEILPTVTKLSLTGLLTLSGDGITVDKDMRKYFEFQLQRFDPNFKPDMEFLQGLLRLIPIHVLPTWYSIPRTSNNIFESIVEKHLLTPQIFHRYLADLNFQDPTVSGIMKQVLSSDTRISSSDLISKYNLSRADFEEIMVLLEFSLVCCVSYVKEDDHLHEVVTPFYEWGEYLRFLRETECPSIENPDEILKTRESEYAFVEDITTVLSYLQKKPSPMSEELCLTLAPLCQIPLESAEDLDFAKKHFAHLIEKICLIKLAGEMNGRLYALDTANDWMDMTLENKALHLYRHPFNRILKTKFPADIAVERNIREAEKSIKRVLKKGWVDFEEFSKGIYIPLNEESVVMLKKTGKQWQYSLPVYTETECALIYSAIFEWLFECGIVSTGKLDGKDCFAVTAFGRFFFAD